MNLFICGTIFQVITAINIQHSMNIGESDILLSDSTDFSNIEQPLETLHLFHKIYHMNDDACKTEYWALNANQKRALSKNPKKGVDAIEFSDTYTELYLPSLSAYHKLFYYYLVTLGNKPNIHLYEEGITTYVIDVMENLQTDGMMHKHYGKQAIANNLVDILLYEPELYSVENWNERIRPIPKLTPENQPLTQIYRTIFGDCTLPPETYIFLEEAFVKDGILSLDVDLVDKVADLVGKENMVIKLHPRNPVDRFSMRGYKLYPNSKIPWEIILLTNDLQDKVLLTVSSSSSVTAKLILNKPMNAIQLYSMMYIGRAQHIKQKAFQNYYGKLSKVLNREETCFYTPSTTLELEVVLQYIKHKQEGVLYGK